MFFFAGFVWAIWTTRKNKMDIEKKFSHAPTDVICIALAILLKEVDGERLIQMKYEILH